MKTIKWEGYTSTRILLDLGSPDDPNEVVEYTVTGIYSQEIWHGPAAGARIAGTSGGDIIFLDILDLTGPRLINIRKFDLGAGHDILDFTSQRYGYGPTTAFGGSGNDWLFGNSGKDMFQGGDGNDRLKGYGNEDALHGGAGRDYLDGGAKDDKLYGDAGRDTLVDTKFGRDRLDGGADADRLTGGKGGDMLIGGGGADRFIFSYATDSALSRVARDTITDFSQRERDKVLLDAIDADTKSAGNQKFDFVGTDAFGRNAGELRHQKLGGDTLLTADRNGDGRADFAILFDGHIDFRAGDFIL